MLHRERQKLRPWEPRDPAEAVVRPLRQQIAVEGMGLAPFLLPIGASPHIIWQADTLVTLVDRFWQGRGRTQPPRNTRKRVPAQAGT